MKTCGRHRTLVTKTLSAGLAAFAIIGVFAWRVWGQSVAPGLSAIPTGTNQIMITVTNGSPIGLYEIWWTEFLEPNALNLTNGLWQPVYTGTNGQTNFVLDLGDFDTSFFRALNGNDFDLDGIPNSQDARPFDASTGILRVTIESPANGSNVP